LTLQPELPDDGRQMPEYGNILKLEFDILGKTMKYLTPAANIANASVLSNSLFLWANLMTSLLTGGIWCSP